MNMKLQPLSITAWSESLILKLSCFKLPPAVVIQQRSITRHCKCQPELILTAPCLSLGKLLPRDCEHSAEPLVSFASVFCGQDSRRVLTWTNRLCHKLNDQNGRKGKRKRMLLKYLVQRSVFSSLMLFFTLAKKSGKRFAWHYSKNSGQTLHPPAVQTQELPETPGHA